MDVSADNVYNCGDIVTMHQRLAYYSTRDTILARSTFSASITVNY